MTWLAIAGLFLQLALAVFQYFVLQKKSVEALAAEAKKLQDQYDEKFKNAMLKMAEENRQSQGQVQNLQDQMDKDRLAAQSN